MNNEVKTQCAVAELKFEKHNAELKFSC